MLGKAQHVDCCCKIKSQMKAIELFIHIMHTYTQKKVPYLCLASFFLVKYFFFHFLVFQNVWMGNIINIKGIFCRDIYYFFWSGKQKKGEIKSKINLVERGKGRSEEVSRQEKRLTGLACQTSYHLVVSQSVSQSEVGKSFSCSRSSSKV